MKTILTIAMLALGASVAQAQVSATTSDGKKVVLNSNGTWNYEEIVSDNKVDESYDCSSLTKVNIDKVTGESSRSSADLIVVSKDQKKGIIFNLIEGSTGSLIFLMTAVGAGACIDDDAKVNFLFSDGTRMELNHDSKFNCDAKFTLYFGGSFGKKKELKIIATKDLETVRVWTTKGYVEEDIQPDDAKKLRLTIACLVGI